MNKVVKTIVIALVSISLMVSLMLGVYYYKSYTSVDNKVADIVNKGNDYMMSNLYDEAIGCYEEALQYEAGNVQLQSAIVNAYMKKADRVRSEGNIDEALTCYNNAISYDSNNKAAYWGIAGIFEEFGNEDLMLDALAKGYSDTGDQAMQDKIQGIEDERARIQADIDAAAAEEEARQAQEQEKADMLMPLMELFEDKDYDAIKETLRTEEYLSFSDEVIGDTSYYYGNYDVDGKREGTGMAVYENGYYYYGDFHEGVRNGHGIYMRASYAQSSSIGSFIFEGEWADDAPNGQGTARSNYYKDRISAADFVTKEISGNYTNGLEDGSMTLVGMTKSGASRTFKYTANGGIAVKAGNEDSGVAGQYIIATSAGDNLTSDGAKRGVEGFIEQ